MSDDACSLFVACLICISTLFLLVLTFLESPQAHYNATTPLYNMTFVT